MALSQSDNQSNDRREPVKSTEDLRPLCYKPDLSATKQAIPQVTKLLIVDDEPTIVNILSTLLSAEGYEVNTALSGEAALEYLQVQAVDVLVTDIRMDGMNGFELITEARKLDPYVQVIVITAHDCYDSIRQALQHDAYDYLAKPLENHDVILSSINRASAAARLQRANSNLLEQLRASHAMIEDANRRLRELNDELIVRANTDGLTELYNRRHLDESLDQEVSRRNRYPDPLSLVMLDIDRFKDFNDRHGHEGGDTALQLISSVLKASARNIDVVGRFGGEEFVVILPKTEPESAMVFAERLRRTIETTPVKIGSKLCRLTASIGVTGVEKERLAVTSQQMMAAADEALYRAKDAGRNTVILRKPELPDADDSEDLQSTG